jgi:hypothetical protein
VLDRGDLADLDPAAHVDDGGTLGQGDGRVEVVGLDEE